MQTMQNKMTAQVTQVTQLIARLSGSLEGIEAPREVRGEQMFIG